MAEAFSPDVSDHPFNIGILPRASGAVTESVQLLKAEPLQEVVKSRVATKAIIFPTPDEPEKRVALFVRALQQRKRFVNSAHG